MGIAYVQSAGSNAASGTTQTQAFASNNTAGNLLICVTDPAVPNILLASSNPVTDTQGNTWVLAASFINASYTPQYIYYAANCKGGANTVQVVYASASAFPIMAIAEYSGIATVSPLDQGSNITTAQTTGTPYLSPTVNTNQANELLISNVYIAAGQATTLTPAGGWNLRQQREGGVGGRCDSSILDLIVSSKGAYSSSGAYTGGQADSITIIATFIGATLPSGGGGGLNLAMDASLRNCGLRH
jgi:hypothetical protein